MVLVISYGILCQSIQGVALVLRIYPGAHVVEHLSLDLAAVLESRVMQHIEELLDHLLSINARVVPCLDNALHHMPNN